MSVRYLAEGITVSNDTRETGFNNNDLIIGSSGAGKTGGYVIPNIQNISGSMVVSDTKGRLCRMFKTELEAKGYEVYTLDFVDPLNSCGYNPLSCIRRYKNGKYREQDVISLANTVMPELDREEPFWEMAASGYIAFLIAYCLEVLNEEEHTMTSVCKLHQAFIKPDGKLAFLKWAEEHTGGLAKRRFEQVYAIINADKMWSSIVEFANRALDVFEFEEARNIFENKNSFDIQTLGKKKTVLFINNSDTDRTFDQITDVFYTQALQQLCSLADSNEDGRLEVPVRLIMDDFASGARIPDFGKIISVIRSREISVSLILQSMTQLESMYTRAEAKTIINNCDHLLYLGSQDIETAEFVGYKAYKTPESILCLPRNNAILMTNGEKARLVEKIKPYSTLVNAV